ncbi:hypothetical protein [Oryzobacter terrae]|uniref:hypothetical protein n=1 Tax=Oryzobacter terrae TaxID=1620385 RepID=UPI003672CB2C
MRTTPAAGASAALRRAVLLLPLVAGVLAMHVLFLCAEGGSGPGETASHARHGSTHASSSMGSPGHHVPSLPSVPDVEDRLGISPEAPAGALAACLAVLVAAALLRATGSPWRSRGRGPGSRRQSAPLLAMTHPPPRPVGGLLLCVSRT